MRSSFDWEHDLHHTNMPVTFTQATKGTIKGPLPPGTQLRISTNVVRPTSHLTGTCNTNRLSNACTFYYHLQLNSFAGTSWGWTSDNMWAMPVTFVAARHKMIGIMAQYDDWVEKNLDPCLPRSNDNLCNADHQCANWWRDPFERVLDWIHIQPSHHKSDNRIGRKCHQPGEYIADTLIASQNSRV